ncbi:MAG TPA: hypothetical protein VFE62_16085 [Gemmataceae bacterium]|nr:hypothetical protein [Gemmataceae bacterium]
MLDNPLLALIIQVLIAGEAAAGIPNTPIAQSFQPTQQGANSGPTIYLQKLFDQRYGSTERTDVWDEPNSQIVHTEIQQYETTFQLSAEAQQNPATPTQMTASDILNFAASILSSDPAIQTFEAQGIGIYRITQVRNPAFRDDYEQYEFNPNFDFVLTHKQIITTSTPVAQTIELQVKEV